MPFEVMDHNLSVIEMHYKKHHSLVNVTRKGNNNRIWFLYNSEATSTVSLFPSVYSGVEN